MESHGSFRARGYQPSTNRLFVSTHAPVRNIHGQHSCLRRTVADPVIVISSQKKPTYSQTVPACDCHSLPLNRLYWRLTVGISNTCLRCRAAYVLSAPLTDTDDRYWPIDVTRAELKLQGTIYTKAVPNVTPVWMSMEGCTNIKMYNIYKTCPQYPTSFPHSRPFSSGACHSVARAFVSSPRRTLPSVA